MTIKTFAFSAQQRIAERCGISLPRSHIYELLAAAFGFGSHAAQCADSVFDAGCDGNIDATAAADCITRRMALLGINDDDSRRVGSHEVASELIDAISEYGLRTVHIDQVIESLTPETVASNARDDIDMDIDPTYDDTVADDEGYGCDGGISEFLRSGLQDAARRGNSKAHYALSLILAAEGLPAGSSYWRDRQLEGDELSGAALEWANDHRVTNELEAERVHHLREAARLGHPDACILAAAEFDEPGFLSMIGEAHVRDPMHASEVAASFGLERQAGNWCAVAARAGDFEAIRQMVKYFDQADLQRRWMWLHFARLLGVDLTRDNYRLVNEDGTDYDDDVGGPGFPVGEEGIRLPGLDDQQDADARRLASAMVERMQRSREP